MTIEFFVTSLIIILLPGTGVLYTISASIFSEKGKKAGLAAALGCTLGILPHLTASILGLSALMHQSALLYRGVKYAGVVYLFYLAWGMWTQRGSVKLKREQEQKYLPIMGKAILINLLNPKLTLFFVSFIPQFISQKGGSATGEMILLSGVFMLMTLIVFILYSFAAFSIRRVLTSSGKAVERIQSAFGVIFALLGIKLLTSDN